MDDREKVYHLPIPNDAHNRSDEDEEVGAIHSHARSGKDWAIQRC
jgi:hypothetical protein